MNEILESAVEDIEDTLEKHKGKHRHTSVNVFFTLQELEEILKAIKEKK